MSDMMVKPPFRWSFSQWETYDQCPAKWKYGSVLKLPRKPPGPAAARGLEMHDSVEKYITGQHGKSKLHPDIDPKYHEVIDEFKNHPNGDRHTEYRMAFDPDWYLCGPSSQYAACIAVLDAARYLKPHATDMGILKIAEWKSGKPKDTHADQRKLYAMLGHRGWKADRTEVTTYYLEDTHPPQRLVLESDTGFEKLKTIWIDRISTMQRDEICAPRPSWKCRFCDFSKEAGGPCMFS